MKTLSKKIKSLITREYLWNGDDEYQVCDGVESFTGEDMTEEEWNFYDLLLEKDSVWGIREDLWSNNDSNYVEQYMTYSENKLEKLLEEQN